MTDRYTIIDEEEPRKQSVAYEGIPCTARTCVTRLNHLTRENKQLKLELGTYKTSNKLLKKTIDHYKCLNKQLKNRLDKDTGYDMRGCPCDTN